MANSADARDIMVDMEGGWKQICREKLKNMIQLKGLPIRTVQCVCVSVRFCHLMLVELKCVLGVGRLDFV